MYLNEQIPMVCLGCSENKYFSLDLIFGAGKNATEPSCTGTPVDGKKSSVCVSYMYLECRM